MSDLAVLQKRVANAFRQGSDDLSDLIISTPAITAATRSAIYADAYILRLEEALRSNYPKLHLLLGDVDFMALARAYVDAHPSRRPSIRWLGDTLVDFMYQTAPWSALPALSGLAAFEWALGCAFDAADASVAGPDSIVSLNEDDWPALMPRFHPSLNLCVMQWNVVPIWQALDKAETPPAPQATQSTWMVWRSGLQPQFRSLPADEARFFTALKSGLAFAQACESLLEWHTEDDAPMRAGTLLGQWLAEGWISNVNAVCCQ